MDNLDHYLADTAAINHRHPAVAAFVDRDGGLAADPRQKAIELYYAVRDTIRYDPYRVGLSIEEMRASTTIANGYGWCVPKAVVLAACCRACGIPARLGFGDVKNHMTSPRLRERMGTDVFYWHGFTEIWLGERWVKATPAFNRELCDRLGVAPLEFDGREDSLLQPLDGRGRRYLEYLRQRGSFADLPLTEIVATFRHFYPVLLAESGGNFAVEATLAAGSLPADNTLKS